METQKNFPGATGIPTRTPADLNEDFPSGDLAGTTIWVKADLMTDLRAAARQLTNLAKEINEDPVVFLGQIMDAFHYYIHLDPEERANTGALVFINQSTSDIRRKLLS